MSFDKRNTDLQPPQEGLIARFIKKIILRDGYITSVHELSEHFRLIALKGEGLKNLKWTPGDKMQIGVSTAFQIRAYTPIFWDTATDSTELLIYLHSDTPGCRWARSVRPNQIVQFTGPRHSLDLASVAASAILFGDETSFALAAALRRTPEGAAARYIFEVTDPAESKSVLSAIGISNAVLIKRTPNDGHLTALREELSRMASVNSQFVLSGRAAAIKSVKNAFAATGISNAHQKTSVYWALGKTGLS